MVDARVVLQPTDTVTWRANARYERRDYDGTYWMYNPLTGQWGYPAENGSQGSVVPGESGIWAPIISPGAPTRVRNVQLDRELNQYTAGVHRRLDASNPLGATNTRYRTESHPNEADNSTD